MALVKYGGGIIQMSGSIAGQTHARNHYGNYIRARTKPINPQTSRQTTVRSGLAQLADRWARILTPVQREAWNLYGASVAMKNKLGEVVYMTGFNQYIRSNNILLQSALAVVDNGPVIFELPAKDPTFALAASEATQTISYTFDETMEWATEIGAYLIKYMGQPQNPQRNYFNGPWRLHGTIDGAAVAPTSPDAEADPPFAFAENQRVWCYARIARADGRLSEVFRADTFCAA